MLGDTTPDVSRETLDRLRAYGDLVLKWTKKINLIAKSTESEIWNRHIVDSMQLYRCAPKFDHWADIGSGGGFPGIVMAIMAKELNHDARFTLVESDARKCAFLRTAARELNLSVEVVTQRIENADPLGANIVSARALGSLQDLMPLISCHLAKDGTALLMKGRQYSEELKDVADDWAFDLTSYDSITDPESRILSFTRITRVA